MLTVFSFFKSQTTITDRIILLLSIILLIFLYKNYWIKGQSANYALILVANQQAQRVDLQHNQQLLIQGRLGKSLIEIADGHIRFIDSPCHGKYCIHAGWLSKNGDFMACLPNQISLELHNSQEIEFDSIAY